MASRTARIAWAVGILTAAGAGALATAVWTSGTGSSAAPLHLSIPLAPNQQLAAAANPILLFSPDGSSVIMPMIEDGRQWLVRRRLTGSAVERIEGTEGGSAPFFSPDGAWLGFIAGGKLMKVAADGGRPFVLADQQGAGGAAWGTDGRIVFGPSYSDGLFRVSADGGERERLTTPEAKGGELGHWWPQILPGGRAALFTAFRSPVDASRIGVVSLETGEVRYLVDGGYFGRYVHSGHLLYVKGGRLYAAPFDPASATVTGPAQTVLDDVFSSHSDAAALVDVSVDGTLAWVPGTVADPLRELLWVHRDGRTEPAAAEKRRYRAARLSPDGRTIATAIQGESVDVWTYSVDRGTLSRVTTGPRTEFSPFWSRDGKTLFYVLDRPPYELQRIAFGQSGSGQPLWPATLDTVLSALSADGRWMLYNQTALETSVDIWVTRLDGAEPARVIRSSAYDERFAAFSPDTRWIVYESNESGRSEIYVEAFPGPGERFQISADGGTEPLWAHGSGEIFYRHGDDMRVVRTRTTANFEFDPARTLFTLTFSRSGSHDRNYDVTPDGQRVLLSRIPDVAAPRRIDLVTRWLDDLSRRVPTGR
jgi:Tol biopolymer transport system component